MSPGPFDNAPCTCPGAPAPGPEAVYPLTFASDQPSSAAAIYLREPTIRALVEFFERKGLPALKDEDQREAWYEDWVACQAEHRLYADLLTPRQYSTRGGEFDLLRYARFLEVFAYFSPAHGYSLQVTFLGLFSILMGDNAALKREAITALESGALLAFGVSEQAHGSDLLGNEFTVAETSPGRYVANGAKYYIGNSNCASIISVLARKKDHRSAGLRHDEAASAAQAGHTRRAPFALFALRPAESKGFRSIRKIRTLGVRSAFVGEFEVKDHEFPESDLVAEGRQAWDAVFGTVTLGKFFLGFGSIGICEHAFHEAAMHLSKRVLYGKPVIEMPHVQVTMSQAYARLTAMKLYAYRTLDYVHGASAMDRRYLLFAAVQKAKVSTEGVKVMALLSECIGARGFEAETYFEMALRDVQLIPGLEGSTHVNLGLTAQFLPRYFNRPAADLTDAVSLLAGEGTSGENAYLLEARAGAVNTIAFPHFLKAYGPLMSVANVRLFAKAAKAFQLFMRNHHADQTARADTPGTLALGQCLATIAYAQLVAEGAVRSSMPAPMVAAVFHTLVTDFNLTVLALASCSGSDPIRPILGRRLVSAPKLADADRAFVCGLMASTGDRHGSAELAEVWRTR